MRSVRMKYDYPRRIRRFQVSRNVFVGNVGSRTGILVLDVVRSRRLLPPILTQVLAR